MELHIPSGWGRGRSFGPNGSWGLALIVPKQPETEIIYLSNRHSKQHGPEAGHLYYDITDRKGYKGGWAIALDTLNWLSDKGAIRVFIVDHDTDTVYMANPDTIWNDGEFRWHPPYEKQMVLPLSSWETIDPVDFERGNWPLKDHPDD